MPRKRSPHPGVVLIPPSHGHASWRARFVDPDVERTVKVRLDGEALRNDRERRDWAKRKSAALAKRRMDLEAGAPRETGSALSDAIGSFYDDHPHLGERTTKRYREATAKLESWCARNGIASCDDVTAPRLVAFRGALAKAPKRVVKANGKRGARTETDRKRAPDTVNGELRAIGTVLGYLRRRGMLPKVGADAIRDALRKLPAPRKPVTFLTRAEIGDVMRACVEHDEDCYAETRAEHKGKGERGTTARYRAVTPIVRGALITGARIGALVGLRWRDVGENQIRPSGGTSTKRTGVVELDLVGEGFREWLRANRGEPDALVFGFSRHEANAALRRLVREYGAPPKLGWHLMRRTCATYLVNASSLFGAASAWRAAKWIGDSVQVLERHYAGLVRVPDDARDVEAALGIAPA